MIVVRLKTLIIWTIIIMLIICTAVTYAVFQSNTEPAAAVDGDMSIELPILMYHSLTDKAAKINTYTVSKDAFEADLKYLKEHGYTAVFLNEVIDYVDGKGDLPEKPIVITFDDGFRNNLTIALPLLEKYDMKAVISIVGSYSEKFSALDDKNPDYAYLDWNDINELNESGRVEIDSHTYNMHMLPGDKGNDLNRKGAAQIKGEDSATYKSRLSEDLNKNQALLRDNCGITPIVFTYPYGEMSKTSEAVIKELGFRASLSCLEKTNYITRGNPDCLYCLCRRLRSNKKSAEAILANKN